MGIVHKIKCYVKLFYLYVTYWSVGLDPESFNLQKGNVLADLGYYHAAIHAFKKAKKGLKTHYVLGSLGWCYLQIDAFDNALDEYRKAYTLSQTPEVMCGLAVAELKAGSIEESKRLYSELQEFKHLSGMDIVFSNLEEGYANLKIANA